MMKTRESTQIKTKKSKGSNSNRKCNVKCQQKKCSSVMKACIEMTAIDQRADALEERYEALADSLKSAVLNRRSNLTIARILEKLFPVVTKLNKLQARHAELKKICMRGNPNGRLCTTTPFTGNRQKTGGKRKTSVLLNRRSKRVTVKKPKTPVVNNRRNKMLKALQSRGL
jgi:hypothetical protein